jgi:hypothetical protein
VSAVRTAHLQAPVLVVIGEVVQLRDRLKAHGGQHRDRVRQDSCEDPTGVYELTE